MRESARYDPAAGPLPPGRAKFSARRHFRLTLTAATVAALLVAATLVFVAGPPPASALSGRRVCSYIEGFDDDFVVNRERIAVKEYVGVNWSKDRDCPTVKRPFGEAGEMPSSQPVQQYTCESYPEHIGIEWRTASGEIAFGKFWGDIDNFEFWDSDMCANMENEGVYLFYVVPAYHRDLGVRIGDWVVRKAMPGTIWDYT